VTYHGQKTHEKKVLAHVERALEVPCTEGQMEQICNALLTQKAHKLLRKFTARGRREFSRNPSFYLLEAQSYFAQGPFGFPAWKVQPLLAKARELAAELPPGEKKNHVLGAIANREQLFGVSSFLTGPEALDIFDQLFDGDFPGDEDEFEIPFDDDDY
jgi:hypothetical protein